MDFLHAHKKKIKKGRAAPHAAYIAREAYFNRTRPQDLLWKADFNMPKHTSPRGFWPDIDSNTRANGVVGESWSIGLSRDFPPQANIEVARALASELAGGRPVRVAVHCPSAAREGGEQPHAHILIYPCCPDGIERSASQMARRYNPRRPVAGGVPKPNATLPQAREELNAQRAVVARIINEHAEKVGSPTRVDHRSNAVRGLLKPERPHLGPARVRRQAIAAAAQAESAA